MKSYTSSHIRIQIASIFDLDELILFLNLVILTFINTQVLYNINILSHVNFFGMRKDQATDERLARKRIPFIAFAYIDTLALKN
jgi:hypothetical protein